jgi:hypothetical protein
MIALAGVLRRHRAGGAAGPRRDPRRHRCQHRARLIFGVLEGPDAVAAVPGSSDFGTIGDALDPANLGDALTWALVPVIFALFMTDFFDTVGTAVAVGNQADSSTTRASCPHAARPARRQRRGRGRRRVRRLVGNDLRRERRGRRRGRAHRPCRRGAPACSSC